ncbi:MAG TPA: cytochrome oxidase subunit III, partial [Chitinophagaceae bacterium]|nr:cytochrome oxidase subunit III [Chitinophagaceae bacterium]
MMATSVTKKETGRIHPHKFTLWVAMASIIMAFAGLTSAYIVKKNQSNWLEFQLPLVFWYSTAVIIISSVTMHLALKSFKAR